MPGGSLALATCRGSERGPCHAAVAGATRCPQPYGTSEGDGQQDTGTEAGGPGNVDGDHMAPQHGHGALAPGTELSPGGCHQWATPEVLPSTGCHQRASPSVASEALSAVTTRLPPMCHPGDGGTGCGFVTEGLPAPGATTPLSSTAVGVPCPTVPTAGPAHRLSRERLCHPVTAAPCPHAGLSVTPRARGSAECPVRG